MPQGVTRSATRSTSRWRRRLAMQLVWLCVSARGVVFWSPTSDPAHNTTAPTGSLAGSGWECTVPIGGFLGTFIHSNALLVAKHIGLGVGNTFTWQSTVYTVTSRVDAAGSDLRILFFNGGVTNVARLNIEPDEVGRWAVVQGRGLDRGDRVTAAGHTNGWKWGNANYVRRWGVNRFEGFANYASSTNLGLAWATFDYGAHPDECMLSDKDSSGPSFIPTPTGWRLAGLNYAVWPYRFSPTASSTNEYSATLYDCGGLYYKSGTNWTYVTPQAWHQPCAFYVSRIAPQISWITNVIAGISFPADVGLSWHASSTATWDVARGVTYTLTVTNRGPYIARDISIELAWVDGLRLLSVQPTTGVYDAVVHHWNLPTLSDGGGTELVVQAAAWRHTALLGTNLATVIACDKPDPSPADNMARFEVRVASTATLLLVR